LSKTNCYCNLFCQRGGSPATLRVSFSSFLAFATEPRGRKRRRVEKAYMLTTSTKSIQSHICIHTCIYLYRRCVCLALLPWRSFASMSISIKILTLCTFVFYVLCPRAARPLRRKMKLSRYACGVYFLPFGLALRLPASLNTLGS
jgi:hypothetical protein